MAAKDVSLREAELAMSDVIGPVLRRLSELAPRPSSLEATGLSPGMLADLVLKQVLRMGALTSNEIGERLGLVGPVLEPIIHFLRQEGRLHLQTRAAFDKEVRLALTERGRSAAQDAMERCGYVGAAPVPLGDYTRIVKEQSIPRRSIGRERVRRAFNQIIMGEKLCDRVGVAISSGRAIFIFGPAGSGKTYISSRLIFAMAGEILIPQAVAINEKIMRVFDGSLHERIELLDGNRRLLLTQGYDARYVLCERPMIVAGGEMTEDMLDVHYSVATAEYSAPLQLKSNGGVLLIDDLGRQRFMPQRLFDRLTVPLEQRIDHLAAGADTRFPVPCDAIIVFSTNLEPQEIADDAVLRRLGYKIELGPLSHELYEEVWRQVCADLSIDFDSKLLDFVLTKLYAPSGRPLLACHPRDLICMALDKATYDERGGSIELGDVRWAWTNYFLPNEEARGEAAKAR